MVSRSAPLQPQRCSAHGSEDGRFGPFRSRPAPTSVSGDRCRPVTRNDPNAWVAEVVPFVISDAADFRTKGPLPVEQSRLRPGVRRGQVVGWLDEPAHAGATGRRRLLHHQSDHDLQSHACVPSPTSERLTVVEEARLFAMTNVSAADAFIACWDDKAAWGFWRPLTAIREGDNDGNARTVGDPTWSAYMATPPYPDHPSGYNCATAAIIHAAIAFFGNDRMEFTVVKPGCVGRGPRLSALQRRRRRHHRRPCLPRIPLPNRRRTGRHSR